MKKFIAYTNAVSSARHLLWALLLVVLVSQWVQMVFDGENDANLAAVWTVHTWSMKQVVMENREEIRNDTFWFPFKEVIDRWSVTDYHTIKWKRRENISSTYKVPFPTDLVDYVDEYNDINIYKLSSQITNAKLRKELLFLKRLLTASWTSSYACNTSYCDRWRYDTGNHFGIDLVTPIGTPLYAIADGIVIKWWWGNGFGNHIAVVSNYKDEQYVGIFYIHMDSIDPSIVPWMHIAKGQLIGKSWNTWNSTAPHLDLSITKMWSPDSFAGVDFYTALYKLQSGYGSISISKIKEISMDPLRVMSDGMEESTEGEESFVLVPEQENRIETVPEEIDIENINEEDDETHSAASTEEEVIVDELEEEPEAVLMEVIDVEVMGDEWWVEIGEEVTIAITTTWSEWTVFIVVDEDIVTLSDDMIQYDWSDIHEITATFHAAWSIRLSFDDATGDTFTEDVSVFMAQNERVALWSSIDKLVYKWTKEMSLISLPSLVYELYEISGEKIDIPVTGEIHVKIKDELAQVVDEYTFDVDVEDGVIEVPIEMDLPGNYRIHTTFERFGNEFTSVEYIEVEWYNDLWEDDRFYENMIWLTEKWIIKWSEWKLMPEKQLTRAEMITIIMRQRYGDEVEMFKETMEAVVADEWKVFSDVSLSAWYAPYIYQWYADNVVKWYQWRYSPEDNVIAADTITMFGRRFEIQDESQNETYFDPFVAWAEQDNLYPDIDSWNFAPYEKVSRIESLESFARYVKKTQ